MTPEQLLSTERLKGRGIRLNAISPGTTVTPGLDGLAGAGADPKGFYDYLGGLVPLGRNAQPVEIANVAAFLFLRTSQRTRRLKKKSRQ
jgi:NAD(P)-dependent dehydrogenase (short-subunit alcohol dehydrogenase family)